MDSEIYGIWLVSVMQPLLGISSLRYINSSYHTLFIAGSFIVNFAFWSVWLFWV